MPNLLRDQCSVIDLVISRVEIRDLGLPANWCHSDNVLPIRPVTGGGEVVCTCTCWDIRSVNFFCFFKTSTLQLGMVDHLKVRQNCHKVENHYFQFIHKIKKK